MIAVKKLIKKLPIRPIVTTTISGYLTGFASTVLWHLYFSQPSTVPLDTTRWIVVVLLVLLGLVLCYSRDIRCTLTLTLPILFSSKGRSLVVAFAFLLAATGPTMNIVDNVDALITSLSCGQNQLKNALGSMLDLMKHPVVSIKEAIENVMSEIRHVMERVQVVLYRVEELVLLILASIKNAFEWLRNIVSICNHEFGTPFERCMKIGSDAMEDCRKRMGPMGGLCQVTHLFDMLCYSVKFVDVICVMMDYVSDDIIQSAIDGLQKFAAEIKTMFDVSVTFHHDFYFKTVASQDLSNITAEIISEIHVRMNSLLIIFGWLDLVGGFLCVSLLIKAIYFKMKYVQNREFNNKYITADFVTIDENRKHGKLETLLPLKSAERKKYVQLSGFRLTNTELLKIARSILFLTITCIQLFCICFADYSLYWVLALISYYGHQEADIEVPQYIQFEIEGDGGFVGDIVRGIVNAFEPKSQNYTLDTHLCLPKPRMPNFKRYAEIGTMCVLAWIFLFFQPYGLRLRHVIMRLYYPEVAHERAQWLYDHILLKRISFFKLARRKARAKYINNHKSENFAFLDLLRSRTEGYWIFRCLFGTRTVRHCIICSETTENDRVDCWTLCCNAVYCENCFRESGNMCCICNKPIDYGDISENSEVVDSSDELGTADDDETIKLEG